MVKKIFMKAVLCVIVGRDAPGLLSAPVDR